jgi:hypothetical protein
MRRAKYLSILPLILFIPFIIFISSSLTAEDPLNLRVRKGDTISYLAFKIYGMYDPKMVDLLCRENPQIKDIDRIYAGQQLRFPHPDAMKKWLDQKPTSSIEPSQIKETKETLPAKETPAKEEPLSGTQIRANKGVITFLEGQAQVKKAGETQWVSAHPNMILYEQDQIKVLAKSRAELIVDNQTVMRLSENTLLTIQKLEEETNTQKETSRIDLSLGKLWVKAAKLFNPASRYDVRTPTSIAGVQGTVYQVKIMEDASTNIQVFQGMVNVYNPFPATKPSQPGPGLPVGKPQEVTGPGEVPGPQAVSREEWTKIVLGQFQQITIKGKEIPKPTSLDVQKERQNEWTRWNEERDVDFQPPLRPR